MNTRLAIPVILTVPFFYLPAGAQNYPDVSPRLQEMTRSIKQDKYKNIHSIVIARKGVTVYEQYFNGFNRDSIHDSRSAFKSVTSLLIGIALDKGLVKDVNQPVYPLFREDTKPVTDSRRKKISIKNLLEMRSGFDCDEWTDDGKDCESIMDTTKDWVRFSLNLPMKNDPGKEWAYTSCNPMIISGIISKTSGMSVMDFSAKYLFGPMDITKYKWTLDPSGNGMTAGSFYILPRDMLKIGQLVLNNGTWRGKRIISEEWLKASTTAAIPIPGYSFMKISGSATAIPQQTYYGYYWYNEVVKTNEFKYNVIIASGNGGQYIMIIKELGLVAVFTQGNYRRIIAKQAFDLLVKYIIPACR